MITRFKSLGEWPREKTKHQSHSRFKVGFTETLELLRTELRFLKTKTLVICADLDPHEIRNDGFIRSNARPGYSGVRIFFDSKHGDLDMCCDKFKNWLDNIRGIALTLHRLRTAELYGCVTSKGEQYAGWAQLPAPDAPKDGMFPNVESAAGFLQQHSEIACEEIIVAQSVYKLAYRLAAKKLHPDAGGNHEDFTRLQEAAKLLDRHFETKV
jgi:hypothetical protein